MYTGAGLPGLTPFLKGHRDPYSNFFTQTPGKTYFVQTFNSDKRRWLAVQISSTVRLHSEKMGISRHFLFPFFRQVKAF
jgi:hypothetical protein